MRAKIGPAPEYFTQRQQRRKTSIHFFAAFVEYKSLRFLQKKNRRYVDRHFAPAARIIIAVFA